MRFSNLHEQWFNTFEVDDRKIDMYRNPSRNEFNKILAALEREHGINEWPLRAFVTNSELYVWDAYYATHTDMSKFNIPSAGGYIYLSKNAILMNDLNWEYSESGDKLYGYWVRTYYNALKINPFIQRIYGSALRIIGADFENKEGHHGYFEIDDIFIEKYVDNPKHLS